MNPSKEEAQKALNELSLVIDAINDIAVGAVEARVIEIAKTRIRRALEFIERAQKKLPSEASFARDRQRARPRPVGEA